MIVKPLNVAAAAAAAASRCENA